MIRSLCCGLHRRVIRSQWVSHLISHHATHHRHHTTTTPHTQTYNTTPHHHHHHQAQTGFCVSFVSKCNLMAESSWQPVVGAAQRRRQRRLRSWWRHEQQSIAAALATVTHHSSGKVHTANGAPRSQKLATRAEEEEVEHVPHYALRGQETPPPGERPAPLSEVAGPQRSDRTVRHSAGEAPLLVVPSLRGADGVDGTTVSFLLAENLKLQKEEEKERRREREEAEYEAHMRELDRRVHADLPLTPAESRAWRKWAGHIPIPTRRKKKRKKKKLPRCARPRQGCRRPCVHQRQVPAVRSFSICDAETGTHSAFLVLRVQFLDKVLDMPVVVLRQVPGLMVQKTVVVPQLQFIDGRRHSLSYRRGRSPWSRLFSRSQRFPCCCSIPGGRCPCYAGRAVSPVAEICGYSAVAVHHGRQHALRGADADPQGVRCPYYAGRAGHWRSLRSAEAEPHGPDYSADHRVSTVAVLSWWSMFLLAGCADSSLLVRLCFRSPWFWCSCVCGIR